MTESIKVAGAIILADGILSIAYSQDQREISNAGRIVRSIIGAWLIIEG